MIRCGTPFYVLRSIVAMLPAWWRFAQCLRRYWDARGKPELRALRKHQLINSGKYSTTFFVVIFSSLAAWQNGMSLYITILIINIFIHSGQVSE